LCFDRHFKIFNFVTEYCTANPDITNSDFASVLQGLTEIGTNQIGVIELARELDINLVTEIFIRINSKGTVLKQSDFVMSKIAADEDHDGMTIRKAIDYFAHLIQKPEFIHSIEEDRDFVKTDFFNNMKWMANSKSDVYMPSCDDIIRVAFMREYPRAKLGDLVNLLSGRNFETKKFEETIIADTYSRIKTGTQAFINENNFRGFVLTLYGAGFIKKI
jgi:hypothetical protein